jgi:hypothetical protein
MRPSENAPMKIHTAFVSELLVACAALISGAPSLAQALPDFRCKVDAVISAPVLRAPEQKLLEQTYVGKEFTVARRTGHMAGVLKILSPVDPQVIDVGSAENGFKMVATMRRSQGAGAGTSIYSLVVNTFDDAAGKPFLFTNNATAYVGTCAMF